jgi:hypothetical protein
MALPSTNVIAAGTPNFAVTGGVLAGPIGTALPTTASASINAAIKPLGYVSNDGLEAKGDRKVEEIKDWNADIIASLQTEHSVKFTLTLYGVFDPDVLSEVFGPDNITVTPATSLSGTLIAVHETGSVLPRRVWIFDMKHDAKKVRIVLPNAKISESSENKFVAGTLQGFQITVEAFKDDSGVKAYRYYDDGLPTAS